jgi:hypothetical protein
VGYVTRMTLFHELTTTEATQIKILTKKNKKTEQLKKHISNNKTLKSILNLNLDLIHKLK